VGQWIGGKISFATTAAKITGQLLGGIVSIPIVSIVIKKNLINETFHYPLGSITITELFCLQMLLAFLLVGSRLLLYSPFKNQFMPYFIDTATHVSVIYFTCEHTGFTSCELKFHF
jgi:hypothetical protein